MQTKDYFDKSVKFLSELPYKKKPFSQRNWGSNWHSLCSYHGKLRPAIAYHLVYQFTEPGEIVLDPMSGVGTIPFEATKQGRVGIGNDLSKLAYVVTKAKLHRVPKEEVLKELSNLEEYIKKNISEVDVDKYSNFGLNKSLKDYFHEDTFREILCSRQFFLEKEDFSEAQSIMFSSLLHILHGNRPYALSRKSHPLTPYAPNGEFIYKNVVEKVRDKVNLVYKKDDVTLFNFNNNEDIFVEGKAFMHNVDELDNYLDFSVDAIITSPPFASSMKFYTQNWMRLWLVGWEEKDFKSAKENYYDDKQNSDMSIYDNYFRVTHSLLKLNGIMILHLGKSKKFDMVVELSKYAKKYFEIVNYGDEDVDILHKHGISDKGATTHHQFLFLQKKAD